MTLVLTLIALSGGGVNPQLQTPIRFYKNLAVYPIFEPLGQLRDSDYITLDEGLKAGTVVVSEKGAQSFVPRTPNPPQPAQREYEAEVNTLWLTNRSGRKLILLSGEMVQGGQQDRIIGKDTIIPSTGKPVDLGVFCVEHGRWSGQAKFGAGGGASRMVAPAVRAPAQVSQDQQKVWGGVAMAQRAAKVSSDTGAYSALAEDKRVQGSIEDYVRNIQKGVPDSAAGVVVAVNGRLIWVDRFGSQRLFHKYWPALLHSYAMEAYTSQERMKFTNPSYEQAMAFARDRSGKTSYEVSEYKAKLVKTEGPRHVIFRLQDLSSKPTADVHESKVVKSAEEPVPDVRIQRRLPRRGG